VSLASEHQEQQTFCVIIDTRNCIKSGVYQTHGRNGGAWEVILLLVELLNPYIEDLKITCHNAPFRKFSNSAQSDRFALIL